MRFCSAQPAARCWREKNLSMTWGAARRVQRFQVHVNTLSVAIFAIFTKLEI